MKAINTTLDPKRKLDVKMEFLKSEYARKKRSANQLVLKSGGKLIFNVTNLQ